MLFPVALYPVKISLNVIGYLIGLLLSELGDKPSQSVVIALAVIAPVYALTQRNNICWCSAWALRVSYGYPVIGSNCVPQTGRTFTDCATSIEIFKATLPIASRESSLNAPLAGFISFLCGLPNALAMFGLMVLPFIKSAFFFVPISIFLIDQACLVGVFYTPIAILFVSFLGIVLLPLRGFIFSALPTLRHQSPIAAGEKHFIGQKIVTAFRATLEGERHINHLKISLAGLANRARLEKAAKQALSTGHDSRLFRGSVSIIPRKADLWP